MAREFNVKEDLNKYTRDNYMSMDRKLAMFKLRAKHQKSKVPPAQANEPEDAQAPAKTWDDEVTKLHKHDWCASPIHILHQQGKKQHRDLM